MKAIAKYYGLLFLVALFVLAAPAEPQPLHSWEVPLRSSGRLPFHLDACQFDAGDGRTRLELAYAIELAPLPGEDSLHLSIDLSLEGGQGRLAEVHEQKHFRTGIDSPLVYLDLKSFVLQADTVVLNMTVRDHASGRSGTAETLLPLRRFGAELSLSDLFFISSIHRPGSGDMQPFLRGGLIMLPNPSRLFGMSPSSEKAWFYFEVNHLALPAEGKGSYNLRYTVSDLSGQAVRVEERPGLTIVQANSSRVESIALEGMQPGAYRLDLFLTEPGTGSSAAASRYFTVSGDASGVELALPMTPADQARYLEQLSFIATRAELDLFKSLDESGKRQFLIRFWQSKDPVPETPGNEYMIDYFARLAESQQRFKGGLTSDMARIYLRYGVPLDIERRTSNAGFSKPVEIWNYALNGSTQFVFVDRNNDGHWVLVHSNHPDEFSNHEWEKQIQ